MLRARLREQDLHKPSKLRTRRPDSSARGPLCPHRRSRRFCVAPSRLDTAANSPLGCSLGRAGGSWRFGRGRRGAGWRICCRRINTSGRGEGQRRCRTRRGPGIPARSSLGRRLPGPRSPDAPARPAPRPRAGCRGAACNREAGSAPRTLLPPPEPARGERRASARRAAAALGGVGRGGEGSGGGETSRPDARGRGGAARLPLLPLRAPGASPRAALPAARRVHRASEGMCGGRGWSCRRRHRRRASRS